MRDDTASCLKKTTDEIYEKNSVIETPQTENGKGATGKEKKKHKL